jgi:hypothetical protein
MVTAKSNGGSEIRMRRELQTVAVPVFQFGLFSDSSLSFHAGANFNFGGRIHTNGNLFLSAGHNTTLTLSDKVTAVGEIVRKYLDSGISSSTWDGTVSMASGTDVYLPLAAKPGQRHRGYSGGPGPDPRRGPVSPDELLERSNLDEPLDRAYNGYIRNGRTGAKRLDLPLVSFGAQPIDLIRRPPLPTPCPTTVLGENDCKPDIYSQRYYSQAALRILLSDTARTSRACRGSRARRSRSRRSRA